MPGKRSRVPKRDVLPDPVYNSKLVTRMINQIMIDGKKGKAQKSYTAHSISSKKKQVKTRWKYLNKQ